MNKITRDQIELLIELQQKEAEVTQVQRCLDELPAKIDQISSGLKEFEDAITFKKESLSELKKVYRSYDAEIEELWDAVTNAERIPRWFAPITGELKLGGR
jgi:peptidoglycan hydrolase CwlO-like protein